MCRDCSTNGFSGALLCIGLLWLLAGCSAGPEVAPGAEIPVGQDGFAADAKRKSTEYFEHYYIKPGDVLDVLYHIDQQAQKDFRLAVDYQVSVKFPNVPALNEVQFVRPDGSISLPYLGSVTVSGKTVQQVTAELRRRYQALVREPATISTGQMLTVKFVKLPALNEAQAVREDGTISLPYVGVVRAAGKTVAALTDELVALYKKHQESPELYVLLAEPSGDTLSERRRKMLAGEVYVVVHEFRAAINQFKRDLHTAPRGLSRLVQVRPDGQVTFPLLGDFFVAGRTIPEVNKLLNARYGAKLEGLSVDLFLERHSGARVYVLGEVSKPGAYEITDPTPLVNALALGGGALPEGNLEQVVVVRRNKNKSVATVVDANKVLRLQQGAKLFFLQPNDIVYVPPRGLANAARRAREIAATIFFRGWTLDPFRFAD